MATDEPIPGRCNATTRSGGHCEKHPAEGRSRCHLHGGASTGPRDTSHLEENDHAAGNPGGAPPELNTNAQIHDGFADWETAYERFDESTRGHVDRIAADIRETAAEYAPDVDAERRAELAREKATLSVLETRATADVICTRGDSAPGRGFIVEREIEGDDGETVTKRVANPALSAQVALSRRQREIAEELRLWPGFQD